MAKFRFPPTINYYAEGDSSLIDVMRGLDKNTEGGNVVITSEFDIKEVSFGYSTPSPVTIATVQEGERVKRLAIQIITPFNDPSSLLSIGHAGSQSALMTVEQNDPQTAGIYEVAPQFMYYGADTVRLYITRAGSTAGSGIVYVETERNDL